MSNDVVYVLLQNNRTAPAAVTIALLNNQSLQAEFQEIGISPADVTQGSSLQNPEIADSWRFLNRLPLAADEEYSAAKNLINFLSLPAREKVAARNLAT